MLIFLYRKLVITMIIHSLDVNGTDIIEYFGMEEGPLVGKFLKFALESVLEEKVENRKENLLSYLYYNYE